MTNLIVTCMQCDTDIVFTEPAEGTWEPILDGPAGFGPPPKVIGEQVTVRCSNCGHRLVVDRKDVSK